MLRNREVLEPRSRSRICCGEDHHERVSLFYMATVASRTNQEVARSSGTEGRHEGLVLWLGRRVEGDVLITALAAPPVEHTWGSVRIGHHAVGPHLQSRPSCRPVRPRPGPQPSRQRYPSSAGSGATASSTSCFERTRRDRRRTVRLGRFQPPSTAPLTPSASGDGAPPGRRTKEAHRVDPADERLGGTRLPPLLRRLRTGPPPQDHDLRLKYQPAVIRDSLSACGLKIA